MVLIDGEQSSIIELYLSFDTNCKQNDVSFICVQSQESGNTIFYL